MPMEFTTVKRAIRLADADGTGTSGGSSILPAKGRVVFTPVIKEGESVQVQTSEGIETHALAPIVCPIVDGIISHDGQDGVRLPAGGKAANPSLIRWRAAFSKMEAGGKSFALSPVVFDAIPGGEVDLTMVAPVAGALKGLTRGPRGTGIESIDVDGSELIFTATNDSGSFEIARIPLDDVVRAEVEAAADGVRNSLNADIETAKEASDAAGNYATSAEIAASNAAASEESAKTSEKSVVEAASALGEKLERAEEVAQDMETFNIRFTEEPPGSGLFAVPTHGFAPDPSNDGLYLIGTW